MDATPALLQFLGSLAAILLLAGVAWRLKLGPDRPLRSEAEARLAADEAASGFAAVAVALDRDGRGALLRDEAGRILLLRPHGTHLAGRVLTPAASAWIEGDALMVDPGERRFGTARLHLPDGSAWANAIEAIRTGNHA